MNTRPPEQSIATAANGHVLTSTAATNTATSTAPAAGSKNLASLSGQSQQVATSLISALEARGFDLCTVFPAERYNATLPDHTHMHLPTLQPAPATTLAVLVAHSRGQWARFLADLRADPAHPRLTDPWDAFLAREITAALGTAKLPVTHDVRYSWDLAPGRMVAMQRAAEASGLAAWDAGCCLNVHDTFGPWLAFAAVVVLNLPGPAVDAVPTPRNPIPASLQAHLATTMELLKNQAPLSCHVVTGKPGVCHGDGTPDPDEAWRGWVYLRDLAASWLPREALQRARYTPDQIAYHYSKDTTVLKRALEGKFVDRALEQGPEPWVEK
ncbi:hypothetical protein AMAG_17587 [Allomyces macrogynus ATCC 38327]|uniref:Uncharacterized protein n=1 Tax=Allomyces macrogynus (strain ATCC 38327) TaxID=578462 RepID=A0A0L0TFD8_ALLM3|nr:hypothetical protein AMAG_17587 [Allomyces macrogynus ATCC 38327]|eukprot:KNE73391.1 hypothetical protein AMAG_17587 [Allomyces macrogynus ATCC 38327]